MSELVAPVINGIEVPITCPCCNKKMKYYDGHVGYDSLRCPKCGIDWNDLVKAVHVDRSDGDWDIIATFTGFCSDKDLEKYLTDCGDSGDTYKVVLAVEHGDLVSILEDSEEEE